jgi:hypothetical protein
MSFITEIGQAYVDITKSNNDKKIAENNATTAIANKQAIDASLNAKNINATAPINSNTLLIGGALLLGGIILVVVLK